MRASSGLFLLGSAKADPRGLDFGEAEVRVTKNGKTLSEGKARAAFALGSPAECVAWLANTLGRYGVTLDAGDVILSGSLVPLENARPGDLFELDLDRLGSAAVRFS